MKKEIIEIDKEAGIFRVTTTDERWYTLKTQDKKTGLPSYEYIPSVTWITGHYPKGIAFYKWLADKGWDESQALKQAAGEKGSKVHQAIEMLIKGGEIKMSSKLLNTSTGQEEELTVEEYDCILSFKNWVDKVKPEFLIQEKTVISREYGFAGTVDCVAKIDGEIYIIDWKTGQYVWPEYELQLSAYNQALSELVEKMEPRAAKGIVGRNCKLAVLQVGYKRNKNRFKFTEIEDKFDLFLSARKIWENETAGQRVSQKDYPVSIKLASKETKKTKE